MIAKRKTYTSQATEYRECHMNTSRIFLLLCLLCCSVVQAQVIGNDVSYKSDSTTFKGYIAYDDSIKGARPGVIVVHEWWGHNEYARKRADMLAELGYTAIALDMYGDGQQANHPKEAGKFHRK